MKRVRIRDKDSDLEAWATVVDETATHVFVTIDDNEDKVRPFPIERVVEPEEGEEGRGIRVPGVGDV